MISLRLLPVAVRLARNSLVRGSDPSRTFAMTHGALLAARSPPPAAARSAVSRPRAVQPELGHHLTVTGFVGR
jgi:hypothetical protein